MQWTRRLRLCFISGIMGGAPLMRSVRRRKNFEVTMVQTHGLTHINLAVRDLERALRFYEQVFGLREYGRGDGLVHTQAAGRHDILTFAEDPSTAGAVGGVAHFGFRLVDPNDIDH